MDEQDLMENENQSSQAIQPDPIQPPPSAIGIAVLIFVILIGILGNILVCLAVTQFRGLRTVANSYIISLAVADVLVCAIIMPFALYMEYTGGMWFLQDALCKTWSALDIMLSTASILHLCAISVDRFSAITSPIHYMTRRTPRMAVGRIAVVWGLSALVAAPAFFLIEVRDERCISNDVTYAYAWCSSLISFYIPCAVILLVYFKIYNAAKRRARRVLNLASVWTVANSTIARSYQEASQFPSPQGQDGIRSSPVCRTPDADTLEGGRSTGRPSPARPTPQPPPIAVQLHDVEPVTAMVSTRAEVQTRISLARERKAARTIGIVVGAFIVCWLPFFTSHTIFNTLCSVNLKRPLCLTLPTMHRVFTWVGWCNSSVNPVIYTVFNREFRHAFKKLLRCRKSRRT